jgi:predicted SAM-dependent methyltransferase
MRINLGSGENKKEGYINIDLCDNADLKHDLRTPLPFKDKEVEEIMAIHVIESFYRWQFLDILKDWRRVLKGKMTIEFTDLDLAIDMYVNGNDQTRMYGKWGLYGNQEIKCAPIAYHHYVWTRNELEKELLKAGFKNIVFTKDNIQHIARRDWRVICE